MHELAYLCFASRCSVHIYDVRSIAEFQSIILVQTVKNIDVFLALISRNRCISARYSGFITDAGRPALAL